MILKILLFEKLKLKNCENRKNTFFFFANGRKIGNKLIGWYRNHSISFVDVRSVKCYSFCFNLFIL